MRQSHVLSCMDLCVKMSRLPQGNLRSPSCLCRVWSRWQLVLVPSLKLLLCVFVKFKQVLMHFHRFLNLKLFATLLFARELLLFVLHELSNSLFFQHWATSHVLVCSIQCHLLSGCYCKPILRSDIAFENRSLQVLLLWIIFYWILFSPLTKSLSLRLWLSEIEESGCVNDFTSFAFLVSVFD